MESDCIALRGPRLEAAARDVKPKGRVVPYQRGSVASVLFPHTVLSYQNAAGVRYTPPRRGRTAVRQWTAVIRWR